jgi:hypothetical protein
LIAFELTAEFIVAEGVELSAADLAFGYERGYVGETDAIDLATRAVVAGSDPVLLEIADLLHANSDRAGELLTGCVQSSPAGTASSSEKWLYLELKAAYVMRDQLTDALGAVESLYAEFDYTGEIEHLVRHMPLKPGDEPGEPALIERWKRYLDRKSVRLAAPPRPWQCRAPVADGSGSAGEPIRRAHWID